MGVVGTSTPPSATLSDLKFGSAWSAVFKVRCGGRSLRISRFVKVVEVWNIGIESYRIVFNQ